MRNLFLGTLLLLIAPVMGLEGVQQRRSVLRLRSVVDSSRKLQTTPPQTEGQTAGSIPEVPADGEMPAGEQATEQSEEAPNENEAPEVTPNPPDGTPPETPPVVEIPTETTERSPPVVETPTETTERLPPDVPEPCPEQNPECDTQSSNTEQSAQETPPPVDGVPSEGSPAAPPDDEEPSGEDHPEIRTEAPRTQAPRTQAPGKQQPGQNYYNYQGENNYYPGGPGQNYNGGQGDEQYDDQYYEGDDEKDFDEQYGDDAYMDDEERENDDEIEEEWGEGEQSTGKAPKWAKNEDENFFKATEQKIEDVAQNKNALIAICVIAAVVLSLTICCICQTARNPDGCCARSCCARCSKSRNRQQHELEMNTDDTYEYDNSVELT